MPVNPVPEGYHSVTPCLIVEGASRLLDFLKNAFGAEEKSRFTMPGGGVAHAEVRIGDSLVMLGEAHGDHQATASGLYLYVDDTDQAYTRAIEAGATSTMEPVDKFYGDRNAGIVDPCGNQWWIATRIEDLSDEEIARRAAEHKS